jgi:hypothetical protein
VGSDEDTGVAYLSRTINSIKPQLCVLVDSAIRDGYQSYLNRRHTKNASHKLTPGTATNLRSATRPVPALGILW